MIIRQLLFLICIILSLEVSANNISTILSEFNRTHNVEKNQFTLPSYLNQNKEETDYFALLPIYKKNMLQATVFIKTNNNWFEVPMKVNTFISGWKLDKYDFWKNESVIAMLKKKKKNIIDINLVFAEAVLNKAKEEINNAWTIGKSFSPDYEKFNLNIMKKNITLTAVSQLLKIQNNLQNKQCLEENKNVLEKLKSDIMRYFCLFCPNNNLLLYYYGAYQLFENCKAAYQNENIIKKIFYQPPLKYNGDDFFMGDQIEQKFSHTEHALMSYIVLNHPITEYNGNCPEEMFLYVYSRLPACDHCHPSLSYFTLKSNQDILKEKLLNRECKNTKFYILFKSTSTPGYVRYENEDIE